MHNWHYLLHQLVENARGRTLDGEDGTWEGALRQLLCESYEHKRDDQDDCVMAVLITLHMALLEKLDLQQFASHCVSYARAFERN